MNYADDFKSIAFFKAQILFSICFAHPVNAIKFKLFTIALPF